MRSVPEWVGPSDDAAIPSRVKLRIFERCEGRCHISGRKIMPGEPYDFDHIVALVNGGRHAEFNLAPALRDKHKEKTAADVAEKAMVYRKKAKHLGVRKPSRPMPGSRASGISKRFDGTVVRRGT